MVVAYIALGSNLNDPEQQVINAFEAISRIPKSQLLAKSSLYRTPPVGYENQPDFVNAVAKIETELNSHALLDSILAIEARFGRERPFRNAPRILDLDILLYDSLEMSDNRLTVPHPRMHQRGFVLLPLSEIAPECHIPGQGKVEVLLQHVDVRDIHRILNQ